MLFATIALVCCTNKGKADYGEEMKKWRYMNVSELNQKVYPHKPAYNIISYVDSVGCISCKLQLEKWCTLSQNIDSILGSHIPILFLIHPKVAKEMRTLIAGNCNIDILVDSNNTYQRKYILSDELMLQTFLVHNDPVIAVGTPIHNCRIAGLFVRRITRCK